jgi:hypothetical protein
VSVFVVICKYKAQELQPHLRRKIFDRLTLKDFFLFSPNVESILLNKVEVRRAGVLFT